MSSNNGQSASRRTFPLRLPTAATTPQEKDISQTPTGSWDVFLSYPHQFKESVASVNGYLRSEGITTWFFPEQVVAGRLHQSDICDGIWSSRSAVIFVGPSGFGDWQLTVEVPQIVQRSVESRIPVIPALLPGVDTIPRDLKQFSCVWFQNAVDEQDPLQEIVRGITR